MPVSNWSTTAANNGSVLGIDIAENCAAANINNAIREALAQLKTKFDSIDALVGGASFQPLDTDLTAIAALVSAANTMPYATGSGTWALTTLSTFARTLLDDGDAAAARATLGAVGVLASSYTNPGYVSLDFAGTTFKIQWGSQSFGLGSTSVSYPSAYSSFSIAVTSGYGNDNGPGTTSSSTAGFTAYSGNSGSITGFWIAVGV